MRYGHSAVTNAMLTSDELGAWFVTKAMRGARARAAALDEAALGLALRSGRVKSAVAIGGAMLFHARRSLRPDQNALPCDLVKNPGLLRQALSKSPPAPPRVKNAPNCIFFARPKRLVQKVTKKQFETNKTLSSLDLNGPRSESWAKTTNKTNKIVQQTKQVQ